MNTRVKATHGASASLRDRVEAALAKVRPALQADGGDVQLVEILDGVVRVKLLGACVGCPLSMLTLKAGIEEWVRMDVPGIVSVEAVAAVA